MMQIQSLSRSAFKTSLHFDESCS